MGKLTAECAIIAVIGWFEAAAAGAVLGSVAFQKLVRQTAVFIKNVWSGTAAAVQVEEILLCFGGTTSLTEILRQYISDEASALLARLQAINALPDNMLRTAYVFIREYCSKAEVSLRELRIILKNAGKIADEKLKALVDWVRGKPEYYNKIEAEGLELLQEEEAELADKGLLDKVDDVLEEKSGKLAGDETLGSSDVEAAIEEAGIADRDHRLALGFNKYLDEFSELTNAHTWKDFSDTINWQDGVLRELSNPDIEIVFNLTGIDSPWSAIQRASNGTGRPTEWELLQIYDNPQWWDRITWYNNGEIVPNPFD